ncbi:hypothetical protein Dimus_033167 [Dionaea muscipula]
MMTMKPLSLACLPAKAFVSPHSHCHLLHTSRSNTLFSVSGSSSNHPISHPLGVSLMQQRMMAKKRRCRLEVVCYSAVFTPRNLQWISAVSTMVLMLAKGSAINKSFLVPLFALQAPPSVISWMQGEYGSWSAFLALLVRLFFFTPDDLELPLVTLLLVISAPFQAMSLRGKPEGVIISLVIAGYLAFQHFTRVGSLGKAFDGGSIVATLAIICITIVLVLLLV